MFQLDMVCESFLQNQDNILAALWRDHDLETKTILYNIRSTMTTDIMSHDLYDDGACP